MFSGIVGTGVGLYLARTVIEIHGGEIAVRAGKARDRGSRFGCRPILVRILAPKAESSAKFGGKLEVLWNRRLLLCRHHGWLVMEGTCRFRLLACPWSDDLRQRAA